MQSSKVRYAFGDGPESAIGLVSMHSERGTAESSVQPDRMKLTLHMLCYEAPCCKGGHGPRV